MLTPAPSMFMIHLRHAPSVLEFIAGFWGIINSNNTLRSEMLYIYNNYILVSSGIYYYNDVMAEIIYKFTKSISLKFCYRHVHSKTNAYCGCAS